MNDCIEIQKRKYEPGNLNTREIIESFKTRTFELVKNARTHEEHYSVLRSVYEDHSQFFEGIPLACQAGCSYCCHLKVDAKAHEIVFFIEYLQRSCTKEILAEISSRAKEHYIRISSMNLLEQLGSNNRCPALVENICIAYQARPFSCRNYHAQILNTCINSYENPSDLVSCGSENEYLRVICGAAWYGCSDAYADAGYDPNTYDLGCALYEAFQNPKFAKCWRDKKKTFSKLCLVKG